MFTACYTFTTVWPTGKQETLNEQQLELIILYIIWRGILWCVVSTTMDIYSITAFNTRVCFF